ncbi:MAG: hypothetical protein ACREAB_06795 [Blastocatellia bacterium]
MDEQCLPSGAGATTAFLARVRKSEKYSTNQQFRISFSPVYVSGDDRRNQAHIFKEGEEIK